MQRPVGSTPNVGSLSTFKGGVGSWGCTPSRPFWRRARGPPDPPRFLGGKPPANPPTTIRRSCRQHPEMATAAKGLAMTLASSRRHSPWLHYHDCLVHHDLDHIHIHHRIVQKLFYCKLCDYAAPDKRAHHGRGYQYRKHGHREHHKEQPPNQQSMKSRHG